MAKLNFDVCAWEALTRAPSEPEQAVNALRIAAKYILEEQPLPKGLKEWIADAFVATANTPAGKRRINTLTNELFLLH